MTLLSVAGGVGTPVVQGNGASSSPAPSGDGRYVAFASDDDGFVPNGGDQNLSSDVFVRDNLSGSVTRVSGTTADGSETDDDSFDPSISADGRYVAFVSLADTITADDGNGGGDAYVYDSVTRTYERASVASGTSGGDGNDDGFDYTTRAALSANGQFVAFTTDNGLATLDQNEDYDVYVRDVVNDRTYRASGTAGGGPLTGGGVEATDAPAISRDGCVVAFTSSAPGIDGLNDTAGAADIFVRQNMCIATTSRPVERATVTPSGGVSSCLIGTCNREPALNAGVGFAAPGRFIAWASRATDLVTGVAGIDGTRYQVYIRDLATGTTSLVSRVNGTGAAGNADSGEPAVSPDGCVVAFRSSATNLAFGDGNGVDDIYALDRCAGNTLTRATFGLDAGGGLTDSNGASNNPRFADNGELLAFTSGASNLVPAGTDTNRVADVFWQLRRPDGSGPSSLAISTLPSGYWLLARTLTVGWRAYDASGIAGFSPQYRKYTWNSATPTSWTSLPGLANPTAAASTSFTGSTGRTYCWRLADADDTVGNHAGAPSPQRCRALPLLSTQLSFSPSWVRYAPATAYGGVAYHSASKGATMTRSGVVAERLSLVATTCNGCGTVAVKWNGVTERTISLQSSTTVRQVVFSIATFGAPTAGTVQAVITSSAKTVVLEGLGVYTDG